MRIRARFRLVLSLAAMAACGGSLTPQSQETTPAQESAGAQRSPHQDPRAEILAHEERIASERGRAEPSRTEQGDAALGVSGPDAASELHVCEVACQSTRSICRSAARICVLADGIGDEWAAGKCRGARRACGDSRHAALARCRTCGG